MSRAPARAVYMVSLGCPKNRIDSEAILGQLARHGWRATPDPARAGLAIVNTCGFLGSAAEEARSEIRELIRLKRSQGLSLAVAGCLVQRLGRGLAKEFPEIDALAGLHSYKDIATIIKGRRSAIPRKPCRYSGSFYQGRQLTTGPGWAYLRIADGCDNRCAYCLIPSIRGPYRSRPMADIVREAGGLAERGASEVNLVAQDTTNYGADIYGQRRLGKLLERLDRVAGLERIRLLYAHPAHFDDRLIGAMGGCGRLARYIDLPLQHASDRILASMGRKTSNRQNLSLIDQLRKKIPGLTLRTTFMVGYPGETEQDFGKLEETVREVQFERMGSFRFSAEPGTRAARLPGQVAENVKLARQKRLMEIQKGISLRKNRQRIGEKTATLVEGECAPGHGIPLRKGYRYYGRTCGEAPEIDGKAYIRCNRKLEAGTTVKIAIDRAWTYDVGGKYTGSDA